MNTATIFLRDNEEWFLVRNEFFRRALLILIFAAALGIRVVGVNEIPLNYHPIKQFRSGLTARAFYYTQNNAVPNWQREVAQASLDRIGFLGPPAVESIASAVYILSGIEALWIPKLLASLFWLIGGWFLYLIARKIMGEDAALLCTSIYLFLQFGVTSSTSFQQEPLMLMLMIISIYFLIRNQEKPTTNNLLTAGFFAAVAILVKPVTLFLIFGAYLALRLHTYGLSRKLLFDANNILFALIALFPTFLYYGYGVLNTENLDLQAQKSFLPLLLLDLNFWDGWQKRVRLAVGFTLFLGGMLGVFLYPNGWRKSLLFGLWAGYFAMCLVFTYTISTHDYYHLPILPVIALSLGPIADLLMGKIRQQATTRYYTLAMWGILLVALFLAAGTNVQALGKLPDYQPEVLLAEDVGRAVSHSTRTILLAPYDGKPLMYYGRLAGQYWPYWYEIRDEKLWGVTDLTPDERLKRLSRGFTPQYFIITDLVEFENQSDLKQYLDQNYLIVTKDPRFIIYDITRSR